MEARKILHFKNERAASTHDLIPGMDAIAWESEPDFSRFSFVSDKAGAITGYPGQRWIDEPSFWEKHLNPDSHHEVLRRLSALPPGENRLKFEHRAIASGGRPIWLRTSVHVTRDKAGGIRHQ